MRHLVIILSVSLLPQLCLSQISFGGVSQPSEKNTCTTPDGKNGECIGLTQCNNIIVLLKKPIPPEVIKYLRDSVCDFSGLFPDVCCPEEIPTFGGSPSPTTTTTPPPPPTPAPTPSPTGPDSPSYLPSLEREECGVEGGKSAFVLGGENTTIGEFPFLGLLGKEKSGNIKWVCGGAVINKWFVLSAGHCGPTVDYVRLGEWKVVDPETETECEKYSANCRGLSGEERDDCERCQNVKEKIDCETVNRQEVCTEPYQDIEVAEVIIHPDYDLTLHRLAENDIMLVKLSRPAVYNNFVQPVCLPSPSLDQFGETGASKFGNNLPTVVGWGRTSNRGVRPVSSAPTDIQQKLKMPAMDFTDCLARWKNFFEARNLTIDLSGELSPSLHLCAGGEEGKDSCNGDSGGPLMARRSKLSPWQLVGVVSGGTSRCGIGAPGIFTRVTTFSQWIRDNMN